jgi:hypothetical protein
MHINSDAAGYQAALKLASSQLSAYKVVLFLQSKGVTKTFADLEGFRWYFGQKLLNTESLTTIEAEPRGIVSAVFCHPPTFGSDVAVLKRTMREIDVSLRPFALNLTYTVYACDAALVARLLALLGPSFFTENINARFNRFYFELTFPSLLISIGGALRVLSAGALNPALNPELSYNYDLPHSSAVVVAMLERYNTQPDFEPHPVPMIFGPIEQVRDCRVNFSS